MVVRDLATITTLYYGAHKPDGQMCLMEAVAWVAGEAWSDAPECVCPVLSGFGRSWNDGMRTNEERAQLLPYIPLLIGTRGSPEIVSQRAYMALDWLVRKHTVAWLRQAELEQHAAALEGLVPIVDAATAEAAQSTINAAGAAAWAAARAAAGAALEPTVRELQQDAHRLFREMIAVGGAKALR